MFTLGAKISRHKSSGRCKFAQNLCTWEQQWVINLDPFVIQTIWNYLTLSPGCTILAFSKPWMHVITCSWSSGGSVIDIPWG